MANHYTIRPANPQAHLFAVSVHIPEPDPQGQQLSMPNWIPGSYMIRDFSKNVVEISASCNGKQVVLEKMDKASWSAPSGLEDLHVTYTVYAWNLSVRGAHLDNLHGFFNGTSVFLCATGQEQQGITVELQIPDGAEFDCWQVATSMPSDKVDENGFGLYAVENYNELIDHPVEMGTFERVTFEACGVPHEIVLTGEIHGDLQRVARDLKAICEYQIRFFGEPAPVDRYVFLVMVVGNGYGGLEHRASTALLVTREHLPVIGDDSTSDKYIEFLGLCSHEYFHTWNVKRIKPAVFIPFRLESEVYTQLLWFFEGITSYYDDLVLVRAGLVNEQQYFDLLSKTITRVQRTLGRKVQSVTDSSFYAWNKFYKQDENAPNAIVSYYAKGALVAMCLDAELRQVSKGEKSLDDLMGVLWCQWLENGHGLSETEPERLASELVGTDLSGFFNRALYSTEELPIESALNYLGVEVHWRARRNASDAGGGAIDAPDAKPWSGANLSGSTGKVNVSHVFNEGAAENAGLAAGDVIVAVNNIVVDADGVQQVLERHAADSQVTVHYIRHGVLIDSAMPIMFAPTDTCSLAPVDDVERCWPVPVTDT